MREPVLPPKPKRRFKWLIGAAVALAVYTGAGFLVVPAIIKSQMLGRLPELTKRRASVEQVKFNPFALSLTIDGLALKETNGDVFASFDEFYGNFEPLDSLFHLTWVFDNVHLQKPFFQISYQTDGTFNFANLIPTHAPAPQVTNAPPAVLPSLIVHSLSISNGAVAFADLTRPKPFLTQITPIDFSLTNLATLRDRNSPYIFLARTDAGETFAWSGSVTVNPLSSEGSIRLAGLPLSRYTTYSHEYGRLDFSSGVVTVMADYHFASGTNGLDLAVSNASVEVSGLALKLADGGTQLGLSNCLVSYKFDVHGPNGQPLDVSLTNTSVALSGLDLKSPDTGETVLGIQSFLITNIAANVLRREASIGLVKSTGGKLLVRQETDGKLNLLALLPAAKGPANEPHINASPSAATPPFAVKIDEIAFDDYTVKAEDKKPSKPAEFNLDQISFDVKGASNQTNAPVTFGLSMRFQNTGTMGISGTSILMPPSADVRIGLTNIDLRAIQPYVQEQLKLAITGGALNLEGRARYASPEPGAPLASFTGNLAITNFDTADDVLFKDFLKWDNLAVDKIEVQIQPDKFKIGEVKFTGLNTSIIIGPDHRANVQNILQNQIAAATNSPAPVSNAAPGEVKKPEVELGTLAFENGSLHFVDQSIEPHSAFDLQQFGGEIKGLSSQEDSVATVNVKGNVDTRSTFGISGKVNPLGKDLFADVTVAFTNTDLTSFTPYTEKFVGRPLQKGKFSFGVHYTIEKKQLKAENGFYVDQLTFGAKNDSTNATGLPVKLAVALLKDRKGRIQLDVPLTGRTDDPKFKIGPVLWQVIHNLIVKAATSPFSLLGSLVGSGPELSFVDFAPAESKIPASETNKLDQLAKALYERPELTVELNGSVNPALDRDALARLKLEQQLKSRYLKELSDAGQAVVPLEQMQLDPTNRARLLALDFKETIGNFVPPLITTNQTPVAAVVTNPPVAKTAKEQPKLFPVLMYEYDSKLEPVTRQPPPIAAKAAPAPVAPEPPPPAGSADMETQLLGRIILTQDDWRDLMKQRAAAVQDYLIKTGKVTPDRLFITAPKPMNSNSAGEDKVNLTLD